MAQWYPAILTTANAAFTLPNDERLIHVPESVGLHPLYYTAWAFHPLSSWIRRINKVISTESGLVSEWKHQAR